MISPQGMLPLVGPRGTIHHITYSQHGERYVYGIVHGKINMEIVW